MFSHLNEKNQASQVDVSEKQSTLRTAKAIAKVQLPEEVLKHFQNGDISTAKGPVFHTAIIAGTMGAKNTAQLIPLCHPLMLESCKINIQLNQSTVEILAEVKVHHKTGVEMEALTGASIAALTIYDMCKAISHNVIIKEVKLLEKTGGKSDFSSL